MDLQHEHLHTDINWLSRERVLLRLVELKEETKQFLRERNSPLAEFLLDDMWMSMLAGLADIFCHLNKLNISLQGFCTNIFVLKNKTDAFNKKLAVWDSFVQKGCEMLST